MPILKCTKCHNQFETGSIVASKVSGINGIHFGALKTYPVWPWQMSLTATCPKCNENSKLLVIASKTRKIVTIGIIIIVLLFVAYLLYNK